MASYIFKLAPISSFTPTNLGITFPTNFYIDPSKVSISLFTTRINNLFSLLNYNNIQGLINNSTAVGSVRVKSYPKFSVSGTSIYITNVTSQVNTTEWTYIFVSNIQNPSAYYFSNFTVAYYLISQGFQSLQWAYQNPLTYYISSPPSFISINKVRVSDFDILFPSVYTFNISSSGGKFIGVDNKTLSYIIIIPTFYKNTLWANTAPVCKFA